MHLVRLALTNFRNYEALTWRPGARVSVITGPNGSGKTNLLEAVSLLTPGRGLRAARLGDLARLGGDGRWAVAGRFGHGAGAADGFGAGVVGGSVKGAVDGFPQSALDGSAQAAVDGSVQAAVDGSAQAAVDGSIQAAVDGYGEDADGAHAVDIATGTPPDGPADRRVFRLDGQAPRSQAAIAAHVAAVWLTPQMDRLFAEGVSGRRRFLDRLVWALEPGHAREVAAHDTAMAQRNRLLADGGADPAWLAALEDSMARHAVAAAAARRILVARLNGKLEDGAAGSFPAARLDLLDPVAARLDSEPALAAEDWLREALATARGRDAAAGSAALGAHRADLALSDAASGLPAAQASTGQQKALLVGTVLGHAALIAEARGAPPLLLLDEPMVHLDAPRRTALLNALAASGAQVLLTGTDHDVFTPLAGLAEGLRTGSGGLLPDRAFPSARPSVRGVFGGVK